MTRTAVAISALCTLAACGQVPAGQPSTDTGSVDPARATTAGAASGGLQTDARLATDQWIGKWVGVEGLALDVARGPTPGSYRLTVALMDGTASYDGVAVENRIRFVRDGTTEYLRKAVGAETGLKWLADKSDCLMIKPGEGFCRG